MTARGAPPYVSSPCPVVSVECRFGFKGLEAKIAPKYTVFRTGGALPFRANPLAGIQFIRPSRLNAVSEIGAARILYRKRRR